MKNRDTKGNERAFRIMIKQLEGNIANTLNTETDTEGPEAYMRNRKTDYTVDLREITLFLKKYPISKDPPPIDALIDILIKTDAIARNKAIIPYMRAEIVSLVGYCLRVFTGLGKDFITYEGELFKARDRIPLENIFRRDIVERWIRNKIIDEYQGDEADNDRPYDPKEAKDHAIKDDKRFNEIAREYGEERYLKDYTDEYYDRLVKGESVPHLVGLPDELREEYDRIEKKQTDAFMAKWKA